MGPRLIVRFGKQETKNAFHRYANKSAGPTASSCGTAKHALDKVMQLEQQSYENIVVKDHTGLTISLDELSAFCVASDD